MEHPDVVGNGWYLGGFDGQISVWLKMKQSMFSGPSGLKAWAAGMLMNVKAAQWMLRMIFFFMELGMERML